MDKITAEEWYECLKREAWAKLRIVYGIENPTEKDVNMYILYGDKAFRKA